MVASAGCAGWGQDGPADRDDTNGSDTNDDSGQEQNEAEQNDGSDESTDGSDGGSDGNTDSSSGDSDSPESSSDFSGDSSDSDSSDDSDGGGSDDGTSDTQPQGPDSSDGGSTDADSSSDSDSKSDSDSDQQDSTDSDDSKHADDTDEDGSDKQSSQPPANGGDDNEAPPTDGDGNESPPGNSDGNESPPKNGDGNETPPDDNDPNETDPKPEPEGNTVTIDVRDLDTDEPVEIPVRLNGIDQDYDETKTATDGTVTFENVPAGEYEVKEVADGWWPEYAAANEITVDGDASYTLGVRDTPDTHMLTVTVTDAETGEPIEGADVSGVGGRHPDGADLLIGGETNSNGVLTVDAYESGYLLNVSADGYEYPPNQEVNLTDDKSVSFELTPEDSGGENVTEPAPQPPANETNETAAAV